jgi:hypothetical protein
MSKQTAVEWYNTQLNLYGDMAFNKAISLGQYHIKKQELLDQAKQMEKEQIENAYQKGRFSGQTNWGYGNDVTAEKYYNETYGEPKS